MNFAEAKARDRMSLLEKWTLNIGFIGLLFCQTIQAEAVVWYVHSDHLGSAGVATHESGQVREASLYSPYGEVLQDLKTASANATDYLYTGQELDRESNLSDYGARQYDPTLARFTSVDPVQQNLPYAYVNNNPILWIDPDGRQERDIREIEKVFRFGVALLDMYQEQIEKATGEIDRLDAQRIGEEDPIKLDGIDKSIASKQRRVEKWKGDSIDSEEETTWAANLLRKRGIDPEQVLNKPAPLEHFSTEDSEAKGLLFPHFTVLTGLVSAFLFMLTIENDCGPIGCNGECGITGCGSSSQDLRSDVGLNFSLEFEKIREGCHGEECLDRIREWAQKQGLEADFPSLILPDFFSNNESQNEVKQ